MKIIFSADGRKAETNTGGQPLTAGSVGIDTVFVLSADYDGLAVTAVFRTESKSVEVLLSGNTCKVPWEVLTEAGYFLYIGVLGKNGSGQIVIPTVWAKAGIVECGTVVSGIDPEDPTPDIAAQLLQIAQETVERAETAETGAESAKTAAESAQAGAEAAKQAIEDLGVTAHEDPNGPSVQKIVDEETGAITMNFGFKPADVKSVNGKTGEIELTLDDIPDTETYARTTPAQVRQIGTNADDIDAIEAKIPSQASATNQLADKDFVNSSINSSAAFFRGSFASHAALFAVPWQTTNPAAANYVTNNDYAYVADDETHNDEAWRYIYVLQPGGTGNGWQPQFKVNDSPLTAAQLAALNSGATAEIIASIADKYELPANGIPKTDLAADVQQSLDKANTALQPAALEPYRTASAQDTIDAAQNEKIAAAAQATEEATVGPAAIATFDAAAANMPLKSLLVNIEPVQDLHGYDAPWPAGGGKNKLNPETTTLGYIRGSDGAAVNGPELWKYGSEYSPVNPNTSYVLYKYGTTSSSAAGYALYDENKQYISGAAYGSEASIAINTPPNAKYIRASWGAAVIFPVALILASESDATFAPYSNICPISGWTGAEINGTGINIWDEEWEVGKIDGSGVPTSGDAVRCKNYIHIKGGTRYYFNTGSTEVFIWTYDRNKNYIGRYPGSSSINNQEITFPSNVAYIKFRCIDAYGTTYNNDISINYPATDTEYHPYTGTTYPITFPTDAGTVYGGTLDVVNGELGARPYYASYNGETLVGPWISSMDAYVPGSTPTIGAQVVDMGGVITSYHLTPQEVTTLLGTNNIWADTGDVTVTYGAYLETIKAHADRLGDSILSAIAPLEATYTASRAYAVGAFLFVGTKFYKVTQAIAEGGTITPGTNAVQTTVAEQLIALAAG